MKILRTPERRFIDLPDYPFVPRYVEVGEGIGRLRMHYLDEGPRAGPVTLLLHGEPTWSYLYRKMVPVLAGGGCRVLAPDLVGFGKSDKPLDPSAYSYQSHLDWLLRFVEALDLTGITLFCQDWGGLLGLRLAAEHPERFARIVASNTFLPTALRPMPAAFRVWRNFARFSPVFPVGRIVQFGSIKRLSPEAIAAYDAPFPSDDFKVGARMFPRLVPVNERDPAVSANRAAWDALGRWEKPFLTLFGKQDPIFNRAGYVLQKHVPGARGQKHEVLSPAGHFIQEDQGPRLARLMLDFMTDTP